MWCQSNTKLNNLSSIRRRKGGVKFVQVFGEEGTELWREPFVDDQSGFGFNPLDFHHWFAPGIAPDFPAPFSSLL
jgi:hypothetical protein